MGNFDIFFIVCMNKLLNNQSIQRVTTVMGYHENTHIL